MEKVVVASNRSFSPFIMWDQAANKFRLWYNEGPAGSTSLVHRDSPDAITWSAPQILRTDDSYGTTVIKDGNLYRSVYYRAGAGFADGLRAADSPDGLTWTERVPIPLIPAATGGDIADLWKAPTDPYYHLFTKNLMGTIPRTTHHSISSDMVHWQTNPDPVFKPDAADSGVTQFYGAAPPVMVGNVMVFFLRVLRDDIAKGIGYTVLAFSRTGHYFSRSRKPWLVGTPGSFDEAHAWVYGACVKDGTLYLSYAAYEEGHKQGQRHVVVARMPVDELELPAGLL